MSEKLTDANQSEKKRKLDDESTVSHKELVSLSASENRRKLYKAQLLVNAPFDAFQKIRRESEKKLFDKHIEQLVAEVEKAKLEEDKDFALEIADCAAVPEQDDFDRYFGELCSDELIRRYSKEFEISKWLSPYSAWIRDPSLRPVPYENSEGVVDSPEGVLFLKFISRDAKDDKK
jgi:hypothetical protein